MSVTISSLLQTSIFYVVIKGQLVSTDWFLLQKLTVRSTCFGHHYAHRQELKIYTDGCCLWYLALWFRARWSGVELCVMCPVCEMFLETTRKPQTEHITHSSTQDHYAYHQELKIYTDGCCLWYLALWFADLRSPQPDT